MSCSASGLLNINLCAVPYSTARQAGVTTYLDRLRQIDSLAHRFIDSMQGAPVNQSDESFTESFGDGFGFGVDLELLVDVTEMKGDRVGRDPHLLGGGLIVMVFDEEL